MRLRRAAANRRWRGVRHQARLSPRVAYYHCINLDTSSGSIIAGHRRCLHAYARQPGSKSSRKRCALAVLRLCWASRPLAVDHSGCSGAIFPTYSLNWAAGTPPLSEPYYWSGSAACCLRYYTQALLMHAVQRRRRRRLTGAPAPDQPPERLSRRLKAVSFRSTPAGVAHRPGPKTTRFGQSIPADTRRR